VSDADVIVVGGGPAGLAAALELRRSGAYDVRILEREADAGGIPRHAQHQGFGLRDLCRVMTGPAYAKRYAELAQRAGAEIRTETMVTGWDASGALEVTSPRGRETMRAAAIVLAAGCRERPRAARLVAGSRPQGVMTTGTLQQLVHLRRQPVGRRALVVGAEHVSFSALETLTHGGATPVGMVTEHARHQSLAAFRVGAAVRFRVPLWTRTAVVAIHGRPRVEAVDLVDLVSGERRQVECDTVVFTADWIPDHELAVLGGIELDPGTRGPAIDAAGRTSRLGVFAAGNMLHPAETADVAALAGRHVAHAIAGQLNGGPSPVTRRVAIRCVSPLTWISPNVVTPDLPEPSRGRLLVRGRELLTAPQLAITQDGRALWTGRLPRIVPGRSGRLPHTWVRSVDFSGGPVEIAVARARRVR